MSFARARSVHWLCPLELLDLSKTRSATLFRSAIAGGSKIVVGMNGWVNTLVKKLGEKTEQISEAIA